MIYITKDDFPGIFREYVNMVYRVAFGIIRNHEEAEDVVMECFTDLINKAEFNDINHVKAWLIRVAENKSLNVMKSARVRRNVPLDEAKHEPSAPIDTTHSEIKDMVLRLPDKIKTVIYMFYYEDMQAETIATTLNISENTVYKRLAKGRKLLKMSMEEGYA